ILSPGSGRVIKIKYIPVNKTASKDTLIATDVCQYFSLLLIGNNNPDFSVTGYDFGCIDSGESKTVTSIVAQSLFDENLTIDSIRVDDEKHFSYIGSVPVIIKSGTQVIFQFK